MLLKEHRTAPQGFADLVNYAAFVDEGVMLLKDGALMCAWYYEGPDLNSASSEELASLSAAVNSVLAQLGNGWMIHADVIRRPAAGYPGGAEFSHPVLTLIDEEREANYLAAEHHFESVYALTLTYLGAPERQKRAGSYFSSNNSAISSPKKLLEQFLVKTERVADALSARLTLLKMNSEELLTYLHRNITGEEQYLRVPTPAMYLDTLLCSKDLVAGFYPKVGNRHLRVLSVTGFPPFSNPEALYFLAELPFEMRWSNRFIFLDPPTAERELKRHRKHWFQKRQGLAGLIKESLNMEGQLFLNQDALAMAGDANEAVSKATANAVGFGYYTSVVVLSDEDDEVLEANSKELEKELTSNGFTVRVERTNALEAYLGSLPGHGYQNVRRPLIHTLNLADFLPLTGVWPGLETNPSPSFPANSPPLLITKTSGATPFRLNLHVSDVGHSLVLGPTGAGKSTLVGLITAQFFRYAGAQVFVFDKGYSQSLLCRAAGGTHYDVAGPNSKLCFCPLAGVAEGSERLWAAEWLEVLLGLQGVKVAPKAREDITRALKLLADSPSKTLTDLNLQSEELRAGLSHYMLGGAMGELLDAEMDSLGRARFQTFELEHLLSLGDKNLIPVLLYLFHRIEQRLDGCPTLIVLEEAWLVLLHSAFSERLEMWLRTLRKKNASVVLVTQSLADISRSDKASILIESTPTKLLLPNAEASSELASEQYRALGLTSKQIEIITTALPKRHYYYTSPLGSRLFDLELGPVALSFVGRSGKEDLAAVARLSELDNWPIDWLKQCGLDAEAARLDELYRLSGVEHEAIAA